MFLRNAVDVKHRDRRQITNIFISCSELAHSESIPQKMPFVQSTMSTVLATSDFLPSDQDTNEPGLGSADQPTLKKSRSAQVLQYVLTALKKEWALGS
jgi:hypothetical protein